MRREPTPPECKLWQAIRSRQLANLKFRRQQPAGRYILDFYCPEAGLAIELDGETHATPNPDATRDAWLAVQGIRVPRF